MKASNDTKEETMDKRMFRQDQLAPSGPSAEEQGGHVQDLEAKTNIRLLRDQSADRQIFGGAVSRQEMSQLWTARNSKPPDDMSRHRQDKATNGADKSAEQMAGPRRQHGTRTSLLATKVYTNERRQALF